MKIRPIRHDLTRLTLMPNTLIGNGQKMPKERPTFEGKRADAAYLYNKVIDRFDKK